MKIYLFFLSLFVTPLLLFSNNENNNKQQPFAKSHAQLMESINNDREELEKLNTEYMNNSNAYDKELARVGRMAYQSAAGYAICLTIQYIGKITNTQKYLDFVFALGNIFFAINLWEAGKSAYKMGTCIDKRIEINNKIGPLNNRLLHERYNFPK